MQKQFSEIAIEQCFRYDGQTCKRVQPAYAPNHDNDPNYQYNAVEVFTGGIWLFDDTDLVETF